MASTTDRRPCPTPTTIAPPAASRYGLPAASQMVEPAARAATGTASPAALRKTWVTSGRSPDAGLLLAFALDRDVAGPGAHALAVLGQRCEPADRRLGRARRPRRGDRGHARRGRVHAAGGRRGGDHRGIGRRV